MIGWAILVMVVVLAVCFVAEEIARQRSAKRAAEQYRRDRDGW